MSNPKAKIVFCAYEKNCKVLCQRTWLEGGAKEAIPFVNCISAVNQIPLEYRRESIAHFVCLGVWITCGQNGIVPKWDKRRDTHFSHNGIKKHIHFQAGGKPKLPLQSPGILSAMKGKERATDWAKTLRTEKQRRRGREVEKNGQRERMWGSTSETDSSPSSSVRDGRS